MTSAAATSGKSCEETARRGFSNDARGALGDEKSVKGRSGRESKSRFTSWSLDNLQQIKQFLTLLIRKGYQMHPEMKKKVTKAGRLRLSPNEEAQLLREEYERRRKLRLQQVREQERNIALQIRQDVKQRREEHLHLLAEELKAEWQKAQDEKIRALEKLYQSSLRAIGEAHRQAKENEPDLETLAKQAEERRQRAEKRHKEALQEQKNRKEKLLREKTRRANARKHALDIEKERAAKIASLPPPPPHPFENVELQNVPTVKVSEVDTFSITRHHLFDPYVDREMDTEQPDARLLAEEEAKRKEALQKEEERERREQMEKAHLRGKHALRTVLLARDREKLMKELEQLQNMDLARRRQIVAQMPPQLFEPSYRRAEIKEEWQRELECAFEDMYTGDRKMKGDLILHLDPQPLPTSEYSQDDELELSLEPDSVGEVPPRLEDEVKKNELSGNETEKAPQPQSKPALKKLLNKIRNQKDHWTSRCEPEVQSEIGTIESGTISSGERRLCDSEPFEQEIPETLDQTILAGNTVLNHPQATKKVAERQNQMEWLEHQKQQQLTLLQQIEEQKIRLEADLLKAQMHHQEQEVKREQEKKDQESQTEQMNGVAPVVHLQQAVEQMSEIPIGTQAVSCSKEEDHIQMIRDYQQRLLMQNRMHRDSVEEARKHLHEYQNKLKQRYQSISAGFLAPADRHAHQHSIPAPQSQVEGFNTLQRLNLIADQLSKKVPVQEPATYPELPLEQKNREQRLGVSSGGEAQPVGTQEHQRPLQFTQDSCSHQEKEKPRAVETLAMPSLEFHGIPGSPTLKSADSFSVTQPVAHVQNVPADSSPESSEMLWSDELVPHAPLVEKSLLPTSLKHQHILAESRLRTSDQTCTPSLQSVSSFPLPVVSGAGRTQETLALKSGSGSLSDFSDVVELRDRMLASSESIRAQQKYLKELQEQLDEQREALLSRQKIQEDLLMRKHAQLKQEMEQQQEALKEFLERAGQSSTCTERAEAQVTPSFDLWASLSNEARDRNQEEVPSGHTRSCAEDKVVFQNIGSAEQIEPFQNTWGREQRWRPSKPPLAKVKLGLDLEQHELSIIPELDTPRSGRLSTTGCIESFTGDICLTPSAGKWLSKEDTNESLHEETDILRITADDKEHVSSENEDQSQGSRHEAEFGGLRDSVHSRELTHMAESLPSYVADNGNRVATHPDLSFGPKSMAILPAAQLPGSLSPRTNSQQVACGYFSALSAVSSKTSYNPDRSLVSTESTSTKEWPRHFSSPVKEYANVSWDSSVSLLPKLDDPSETSDSHLSFGETLHFNGSKVQQITEKYTRDFSWSSLSNVSSQDPADGLNVTDLERNFPNFHRELFQPLEPSPDFNICSNLSLCRISHNNKELRKSLDLSKSHELATSNSEERTKHLSFLSILNNNLPKEQTGEEVKEQMQATEELFEHLPVESAFSKLRLSVDKFGACNTASEPNLEISTSIGKEMYVSPGSIQCKELDGDEESISLCSSTENFRSLTMVDDHSSLYQLIPDHGTMANVVERTEPVEEDMQLREENLCFEELPMASTERTHDMIAENVSMNGDIGIDLSQCSLHSAGEQSPLRAEMMLSLPQEMNSKILISPLQNALPQSGCEVDQDPPPNLNASQAKTDSCLSQSNIPAWKTLTGRGIMEEPELTLISSNDVSTAESDFEPLNQADPGREKMGSLSCNDSSGVKNCTKSRVFLPSPSEVDDSFSTHIDYPSVTSNCKEDSDKMTKPRAVSPELMSVPGSLQESFLQRKKDFIERSTKRLEKLKNREQSSGKPQPKTSHQKKSQLHKPKENLLSSGAAVSHMKKVEEVKVCSADDRKTAEIQMHQRTSRLYNNLAEVKIRKEEKKRQENYAKNREKAKEFQKKTLEKLRARKAKTKSSC